MKKGIRGQGSGGATMVQSFRDLIVWQKAIRMAVKVYRLTQKFPREEIYGLSSQMRRAAVSVPSNIAEGHGRLGTVEYRQFLGVARGSNFELQTRLEIARQLGMGDAGLLAETDGLSHEVGKMIFGVLDSIQHKGTKN